MDAMVSVVRANEPTGALDTQ